MGGGTPTGLSNEVPPLGGGTPLPPLGGGTPSEAAICFTTHLRSAYLSASVRKSATSLLMFSVRTLSETNLRRRVSGFRMLWRILPDVDAICACWVGTFGMDLMLPYPATATIGVTRISSFTSVSRQYFRSLYFSRASLYLMASASASAAVALSVLVLNDSYVARSAACSSNRVLMSRVLSSAALIWSLTMRRTRYRSIARFRSLKSAGGISLLVASFWNAFWTTELAAIQ